MPEMDTNRVVIPYHALFRCAQRTGRSMNEATSFIREILESNETQWSTVPPVGVRKKRREDGVHYGIHAGHGVLVVFDEHDRSGNGYIPTVYGWDVLSQEAKA